MNAAQKMEKTQVKASEPEGKQEERYCYLDFSAYPDLHRAIKQQAEKEFRPMDQQVLFILNQAYSKRRKKNAVKKTKS